MCTNDRCGLDLLSSASPAASSTCQVRDVPYVDNNVTAQHSPREVGETDERIRVEPPFESDWKSTGIHRHDHEDLSNGVSGRQKRLRSMAYFGDDKHVSFDLHVQVYEIEPIPYNCWYSGHELQKQLELYVAELEHHGSHSDPLFRSRDL